MVFEMIEPPSDFPVYATKDGAVAALKAEG
jgi:hypothetical protein